MAGETMTAPYTEELTQKIVSRYQEKPTRETIDAIAEETGKSYRSVIAKLSSEGVYQSPKRTTKTGEVIIKKPEMVADIEEWLGIQAPTLAKSGKEDLRKLHTKLSETFNEQA